MTRTAANPATKRMRREIMTQQNFTTTISVDQSPTEVFHAINNVRGWWSGEIDGSTDKLGAEFTYRYQDLHRTTQKITEFVPGKKVVWHIVDSHLSFVADKTEWNGTDVVFEITKKGDKTELRFTHVGLVPAIQCYGDCSGAWGYYINESLLNLITKGQGHPNEKEKTGK
jgi:activator of Hsp90 ATPase-like protein